MQLPVYYRYMHVENQADESELRGAINGQQGVISLNASQTNAGSAA